MLILAQIRVPWLQQVETLVAMIETWMLMAIPETGTNLGEIVQIAHRLALRVKDTCFGMIIEGERDVVREALGEIRERYPGRVIAKRRGFTIEDTRICGSTFSTGENENPLWLSRFVCQLKRYSMS